MISFIEAAHYKISNAMAEVDCRPKPSSRFQQFIERTKDKQVAMMMMVMLMIVMMMVVMMMMNILYTKAAIHILLQYLMTEFFK